MTSENKKNLKIFILTVAAVYSTVLFGFSAFVFVSLGLPFFWTLLFATIIFSPGIVIAMLVGVLLNYK